MNRYAKYAAYSLGVAASAHGFDAQHPPGLARDKTFAVICLAQAAVWQCSVLGKAVDTVMGWNAPEDRRLFLSRPTTFFSVYVKRVPNGYSYAWMKHVLDE